MSDDAAEGTAERPSYPEDWRADVLAADGGVVHLRPITPDDAFKLVSFHSKLSEQSIFRRYFEPHPQLTPNEVYRCTHVDNRYRVCLIALLGDDIIAVGVYEGEPGSPCAEVAFTVSDDHQRRGLGSVLLEHLAGAAAENGIERFEANVLAENQGMVRVFREAGYQVSGTYDGEAVDLDGDEVLELEFAIDPTEALLQVRNARERASESRSIRNLLSPQSIAVIGASPTRGKVGHAVLVNLLAGGFTGPVYPVNAKRRSVQGVPTYPSVRDIPNRVDLAIVAVPASDIDVVLDDCLDKGVKGLLVLSAGFADSDADGYAAQRRLVREARAHGMRLVGPNALGIASNDPAISMNATLAPKLPGRGRAGFFCQSDPLGATVLQEAAARRLGLSTFVSAGNRADVSANDLLQYWDSDPDTAAVLLYLESLGNPRKFLHLARRMARDKPIVVVKSSRIDRPDAHGDAPAIDNTVAANVFHQAGVIAVDSIVKMFDCAMILCHQPLPAGPRTAVISTSAPLGLLAVDIVRSGGLVASRTEILGPAVGPEEFGTTLAKVVADPDVDAVVALVAPPVPIPMEPFAAPLRSVRSETKPIITVFAGANGIPELLAVNGSDGMPDVGSVPSFPDPDRAVRALQRVWKYAQWRGRPISVPRHPNGIDVDRAHEIVVSALRRGATDHGRLSDQDVADLLDCFGIHPVDFREVATADEAVCAAEELGYPVAIKATSEGWRNRPDMSGVRLDLEGPDQVTRAYRDIAAASGSPHVHVQRMAAKGIGCSIKVHDDPSFGSLVSFGLSGMVTELLGDRAYRALPLGPEDARTLIDAPRAAPVLDGLACTEPADKQALADLVERVSALCDLIPEIRELNLEPILASASGAAVLSGQVRIGSAPRRSTPRRIG
ncbi:GNAT family N-acetyltransferase [Gordonia amarae]|uniref:GNAT family N-acetyltransferase n=2 Tax=Gordonia amarae TaxID=36821 RepID=A0A857KMJ9_9ACTN|nr:bifunctional GNAT family N-acetyltransferase/acetate--CoA ligase family protein [Gordonia amarae]MCS3880019.1 acyl-CoA synthetase (NDP forming)/GNAT superfamily N-acetyltransferase [Gordonia amarae]QHN18402.1 GNAT family N-acetyltransferase [Gordonia amarae]QHN22884.1 GNAT family N-acetyltransferase [Gordonia amarae]QHN31787.1 GNAT family N-acetyltransferase [Gordonia amarae]QHN40533.1 GNAT family N-acetyltransferase [Gordonia amarae]